jgi:aspartate dehydrogenase
VRIVAVPGLARNTHEVMVRGDFGELRVEIANVPSPTNPRTSVLAALSAIATRRRITAPVVIA